MRFRAAQESAQQDGRDRYGRVLASCTAGERDFGESLMGEGPAVPYRYDFEAPWLYRQKRRSDRGAEYRDPFSRHLEDATICRPRASGRRHSSRNPSGDPNRNLWRAK